MGPRKDEGGYCGYEEQGNGQLRNVQAFKLVFLASFYHKKTSSLSVQQDLILGSGRWKSL